MSDDTMKAFLRTLREIRPVQYLSDLASVLGDRQDIQLDEEDAYELLTLLADLMNWQDDAGTSLDDLVEAIKGVGQEDTEIANEFPQADWDRFDQRLRELLSEPGAAATTSKASGVLADQERRLCLDNCRILTDIRPIFPRKELGSPTAAVIIHTLKIAYHRGDADEVEEVYIAMDDNDITTLQNLLQRAAEKSGILNSLLEQAQITLLQRTSGITHAH